MESASPDWAQLPPDLLTTIFGALEIPDLVHSGAVCTSWHSAYSTFRRLRLPSPKQSPCLLYASAACGPDAASLYFPSTGATFRMPEPALRFGSLQLAGSGHGWLVAADEVSNLHLLNPITGGHVALPPITEMRGVESSLDDQGGPAYTFTDFTAPAEEKDPFTIPAIEARETMYHRAVLSCSPSAGSACVVLLIHMPLAELSFARVGDGRWTSLAECTGLQRRNFHSNAAYNAADGLFYVLSYDGSMHTLDLNGPSPVATKIIPATKFDQPFSSYLVQTPWGDLLQAWRFRKYLGPPTPLEGDEDEDEDEDDDPLAELNTTELRLYKVDAHGQKLVEVDSVGDHALFLGYNGSVCLPIKDFPWLRPNCAYIADDSFEYIMCCKSSKREIGVWSIQDQNLHNLGGTSPPWLNWPTPVWIVPSLL